MPAAATIADAGMVMNQAITISFATPHRTAETRCPAPAPMMLEETTCVVETGPPKNAAARMTEAEAVCEQKACTDRNRQIFDPIVLIIRHPPVAQPAAIAPAQPAINPERNLKRRKNPEDDQGHGDDPHGLLGIIGPMAQGQTDGGDDLHLIEEIDWHRASLAFFPQ